MYNFNLLTQNLHNYWSFFENICCSVINCNQHRHASNSAKSFLFFFVTGFSSQSRGDDQWRALLSCCHVYIMKWKIYSIYLNRFFPVFISSIFPFFLICRWASITRKRNSNIKRFENIIRSIEKSSVSNNKKKFGISVIVYCDHYSSECLICGWRPLKGKWIPIKFTHELYRV